MRRQRTTPILVIAILHLVGGGLGLLLSLCTVGGLVMTSTLGSITPPPSFPTRPGQPAPPMPPTADQIMKQMNDQIPGYRAFTVGSLASSFLLDFMLLTAGIGLLSVQPWARWLSLVYAPLSILNRLGSFLYSLIWVLPATKALYANNPGLAGFSSFATITSGISLFFSLTLIAYPIAVLIILLMPSTAAAFRGETRIRSNEEDRLDEEEDDDDSWRQPPTRSDKFRP